MRFPALSLIALAKWVLIPLFIVFFFFFKEPVFAQNYQTNPYQTPNTNADVPQNLHTYTQNLLIETMAAVSCQISGIDPVNPNQKCLGVDQQTGKIGFVESGGGAIGLMGNMIAMTFTPPIHTGDYFRNLAGNFGITKQAYAQETGTGFQGLLPIIGLWEKFRDFVYLLFVLVFVVIGIAIMLRIHIDPRTVMTIQNQIPKIIVGIVLVTFSFAIAGFLIDMMYTTIYLVGNTIVSTDEKINPDTVGTLASSRNPFEAIGKVSPGPGFSDIAWEPAQSVGSFIEPVFDNPVGRVLVGITGAFIGNQAGKALGKGIEAISGLIGGAIGTFFAPGVGTFAGATGGLTIGRFLGGLLGGGGALVGIWKGPEIMGFVVSTIAFLIISIAILWALFRVWFMLIKAYIFILLDIIYAPFWILGGLLPGSKLTFGLWIRDLLSHLSVFPTVIAMFLLGRVFMDKFTEAAQRGQDGFSPPMVGNFANPEAFGAIIGLGIILLTPQVAQMMKAAFKAPDFDLSTIKNALGVGTSVVGAPITTVQKYASSGLSFAAGQAISERLRKKFPRFGGGSS